MKLACNIRLVPGESYFEKLTSIARYGFDGVELRLTEADLHPENLYEIEEAVSRSGVQVASIVVITKGFSTPLDSKENLEIKKVGAHEALDLSARFEAGVFLTPEYRPQTPLPLWNGPHHMTPGDEELLYLWLSDAAEYAEKVGAFALLEPINRYETHYYHRIPDAIRVIDKVASAKLKIVIDFFHMNIEEANIAESICKGAEYIAHVQLGDSNRLLPGNGHIDFVPGFKALRQIGYDRYMALECQVPNEPEVELPRCVEYLHNCIEAGRYG